MTTINNLKRIMKKLILIATVGTFVLASCKKDYTCECTTTIDGANATKSSTTLNAKKKDATTACDALDSSLGGIVTACSIK